MYDSLSFIYVIDSKHGKNYIVRKVNKYILQSYFLNTSMLGTKEGLHAQFSQYDTRKSYQRVIEKFCQVNLES